MYRNALIVFLILMLVLLYYFRDQKNKNFSEFKKREVNRGSKKITNYIDLLLLPFTEPYQFVGSLAGFDISPSGLLNNISTPERTEEESEDLIELGPDTDPLEWYAWQEKRIEKDYRNGKINEETYDNRKTNLELYRTTYHLHETGD